MAILGPVTPGRIAFALGTIGVGALVGGAVADHRDQDIGKGALYGGLAAVAGLSLLYGGAYAWNRFQGARAGAAAGATQLQTTLNLARPAAAMPAAAVPFATTTAATSKAATTMAHLPSPASLFARTATPVPALASTPLLPVARPAGGSTFVDALRGFLR